ncbi:MAG: carbohydrate ABC transporter substrate-binding protein, partial [Spirochaetia bacterium]|nr:carbohydrate ABC transporter substrate-binding protein [Spirochaetia bacterium]
MRNLFLIILAALVVFSQIIQFRSKGSGGDGSVPSIYWVTDPHPARKEQVRIFREWLKKKGYPDIEVKLDTANQGLQKTLIQGVTGVAGDLVDAFGATHFLADTGMVEDLAEVTREFKLDEKELYQPTFQDLCLDGKRYATPKNIGLNLYFVNLELFEKLGLPPPPRRWDFDTFEKIGIEFDKRANAGLPRRQVFFASWVNFVDCRKTAGVSTYNETLTACAIERPASLDLLKRLRRWREEYHIAPSEADRQAIAVGQGYGDSFFQLFNNGQCGLLYTGRWALIQIRAMKKNPRMSAVEVPNGGYPCATALAAGVVLYKGSRHLEQAKYFQAYLMSEEYNRQILKDV